MDARKLAISSIATVVPVGIAAALVAGSPFGTIPLGTTDLDGGSDKIDELTPGGVTGSGTDASGEICNELPGGAPMTDVTIDLTNATAATVTVNGTASTTTESDSFNVKFPSAVGGNVCVDVDITDISPDGSGENIEIYATPSRSEQINGGSVEVNVFPQFEIEESRDLQRTSIAFMDHGGGVAYVRNGDSTRGMTQLNGTVSFPNGGARTLLDVELQSTSGTPISSTVSISGNTFTISGFPTVSAGATAQIVLLWDNSLGRPASRLQIEGVFTP